MLSLAYFTPKPHTKFMSVINPLVMKLAHAIASQPSFFPGFEPGRIGVLLFDGSDTYLLNSPDHPDFQLICGHPPVSKRAGRHELVVAHSTTELDGVPLATILLNETSPPSEKALIALCVHEAFHVFQQQQFPSWGANEAELFMYPFDDVEKYLLANLELKALLEGFKTLSVDETAGWLSTFLQLREQRHARLASGAVEYEQQLEKCEGLAQYVESRAHWDDARFTNLHLGVTEVRKRAYFVGHLLASLLDRVVHDWTGQLVRYPKKTLTALAQEGVGPVSQPKAFASEDIASTREQAEAAVRQHKQEREEVRRAFLQRSGWQIVLRSAEPLKPAGFDPMNVQLLSSTELLHHRYLHMKGNEASIELMGQPALTHATGPHPFFSGVQEIVVGGTDTQPIPIMHDNLLTIEQPGITISIRNGTITVDEKSRRVLLTF